MRRIGCQRTSVMLSWAPVIVAAGAGLRGAAEAGVVRAAALNAGSIAAVIIEVCKRRLLACHAPAGSIPAVTDLGLARKAIHEARQLHNA
jgi:hypothetical protein